MARPAVHRNLAAILRRGAVVPVELRADGIRNELATISDAVKLRTVVDADPVVMNVLRNDAERAPVDLLDHVGLDRDRHLRLAQNRYVVRDLSRRQLGKNPFPLARPADALVIDLDERITGLKHLDDL